MRRQWAKDLFDLAASLTLYTATPLNDALDLPASAAVDLFNSKPFEDWKRGRESELRLQGAIVDRLNEVIRGCGIIVKTIARAG